MKIKVVEAIKIIEKYGADEVPIIMLSDVNLRSVSQGLYISQGQKFDPAHYEYFEKAGIKEIDVIFSERLYAKLITNFPAFYRLPIGRKNLIELDRVIDALESTNASSKKKRNIVSLNEIYRKTPNGMYEPVLFYGEKLHFKRWNDIKFAISRTAGIDFRYDECGIIIFFILNASDPLYAQKFMKYTDLISMIVESRSAGVTISQDFFPEVDVYTVNDKSQLLKVYNETHAALIIIGEDLNEEYKSALNQVKAYDRFARMMVIKNPDPAYKVDILNKIKSVYGQKVWEE
jgi:hypothetical protein